MKRIQGSSSFRCVLSTLFISSSYLLWGSLAEAAIVHDLATEFSIASNPTPSGWTYLTTNSPGNFPPATEPYANFVNLSTSSTSWGTSWSDFTAGIDGWVRDTSFPWISWGHATASNTPKSGFTYNVGSVIAHAPAAFYYTVQAGDGTGTLNISGGAYKIRSSGNTVGWTLYKNGVAISATTTDVSNGNSSQAVPYNFTLGNGGASALLNIPYTTGDTFRFAMDHHSASSYDYLSVNFTLTMTPSAVPEPTSGIILGMGMVGLIALRRHSRRRVAGQKAASSTAATN